MKEQESDIRVGEASRLFLDVIDQNGIQPLVRVASEFFGVPVLLTDELFHIRSIWPREGTGVPALHESIRNGAIKAEREWQILDENLTGSKAYYEPFYASTGICEKLPRLYAELVWQNEVQGLSLIHISQDGTKVLLAVLQDSRYYICLFDLEQGTGFYLEQSYDLLTNFCFTPAGDVISAGSPEESASSYGMYDYYSYLVENHKCVMESSGETGQTIWSTDLSYYQISMESELNLCVDGTEVLYTTANVCQRMDCTTGQVLGRCETTAPILNVTVKDNSSALILEDGTQAVYYFDDNGCRCV